MSETQTIYMYGRQEHALGYELRDFLKRNSVAFEWIEVSSVGEISNHIDIRVDANFELPVISLPDGRLFSAPTLRDLAGALGMLSKPKRSEYDLSIYGAGPAGLSAAVYAASEGLKTVLIEREAVGGQAGTTSAIENYLGFPEGISGADLAERAREQAVKFGVEILMMREGVRAKFRENKIWVDLANGGSMTARANICSTGVEWRRLGLDLERELLHRGVYYGAGSSEAPLCKGEHVIVVGGGNSAGQAIMQLSTYAEKVTMLVRSEELSENMSRYLSDRIEKAANVEVRYCSEATKLDGTNKLTRVQVTTQNNSPEWIESGRLFVAIGGAPHTDWAKDTSIIRDEADYLVTGPDLLTDGNPPSSWPLERQPYYLETNVPGSFAAGDVRHGSVKRVATAVGEGAMAVTFVHKFLKETTRT